MATDNTRSGIPWGMEGNKVNQKELISILAPKSMTEASASALKICELFISALVKSKEPIIKITIDKKNHAVRSNDPFIGDTLKIILGSGNLEKFSDQMHELLHTDGKSKAMAELRIFVQNKPLSFDFTSDTKREEWKITRITHEAF